MVTPIWERDTEQYTGRSNLDRTSSIRVVTLEGNPWFVAKDICEVLALSTGGKGAASRLLGFLGDDEKQYFAKPKVNLADVRFPNRGAMLISESGLRQAPDSGCSRG
jgi:prophage antirepressor-like protein